MAFMTEKLDHLQRAKDLLAAGDPSSLQYCCLELRICIELVAYERVSMYEKELPQGFEKWQPKEVIEALLDCDPYADKDSSLTIALENPAGGPPGKAFHLGTFHALTRKFIQRHYHKLGSYLHAPLYAKLDEDERLATPELRSFLAETLKEVERLCSSTIQENLASRVSFTCQVCDRRVTRNILALKRDGRVKCQDPACQAVYITADLDSDNPRFSLAYDGAFVCPKCQTRNRIPLHCLREGGQLTCSGCTQVALVERTWQLSIPDEASPAPAD